MKTAIRKHLRDFIAIIALAVLALGVGGYILTNQRMRFPWEPETFKLKAEFSTAQAVTPGQGQTVRVSGVRVGDIGGVELKDGRAIVTMELRSSRAGRSPSAARCPTSTRTRCSPRWTPTRATTCGC
jgi:phospholipid/cholesterol/gamma-HCH transport system substrate-binding protein